MSKTGKYKSFEEEREDAQKLFWQVLIEVEPKVLTDLPFDSYQNLLRKDLPDGSNWTYHSLAALLEKDEFSIEELLSIFPNADKKSVEKDFEFFKEKMLLWTDIYCLKKVWILKSVCSAMENHLMRLKRGENSELRISPQISITMTLPIEIKINDHWNPYIENFSEYEKRILQKLKEQKRSFDGKIAGHKQETKPLDLKEKIIWLIRWTVQNWSAAQIAIEHCHTDPDSFGNGEMAHISKMKFINKEIQKLNFFDLPIRRKNK